MPTFGQHTNQRLWQGLASNGRGTNQFPAAASPGIAMAKSVLAVSAPVTKASAAASISTVRGPEPRLCASWRAPFARRSRRSMYPHMAGAVEGGLGCGLQRDRGIVLLSGHPSRWKQHLLIRIEKTVFTAGTLSMIGGHLWRHACHSSSPLPQRFVYRRAA